MADGRDSVSDHDVIDRLSHTPLGLRKEAGMIWIKNCQLPSNSGGIEPHRPHYTSFCGYTSRRVAFSKLLVMR